MPDATVRNTASYSAQLRIPFSPDVHFHLKRNLEDLAASGQSWANQALDGEFIYFSAGGFSEYMKKYAKDNVSITLVSLEDMFPDQ